MEVQLVRRRLIPLGWEDGGARGGARTATIVVATIASREVASVEPVKVTLVGVE